MAQIGLNDVAGIEPAMLHRFLVHISGFDKYVGGDTRMATVRAANVNVTHPNTTSEGIFGYGTKEYFPAFTDIDSFTIGFVEDASFTITKALYQWKQEVVDPNGFYGTPSQYKKVVTVEATPPLATGYPQPKPTVIPYPQPKPKPQPKPSGNTSDYQYQQAPNSFEFTYTKTSEPRTPPDGIDHRGMVFELSGVWPSITSPFEYEQDGGVLIVSQEFSVDNGRLLPK